MNRITSSGIKIFCDALRKNTSLELLGFGSMNLAIAELKPLLYEFGRMKLSLEDGQKIQELAKERDAIIEKNKKKKGKNEDPVPKVNKFDVDESGNVFEIRKENFRHLNIGLNKLDDSSLEELTSLLERTHDKFIVTVASKLMTKEGYKILSSKYASRIIY